MKKLICAVLVASAVLTLTSCSLFGLGSVDYSVEGSLTAVEPGGEVWLTLEDMLYMLTVNSAILPEFDSAGESTELCRESLLNYMYGKSYGKYSGNAELIEKISEKNPGYNVICAIPQADFEYEMYRCFGGSVKLVHGSTPLFTYLAESRVYVPVGSPISDGVTLTVSTATETESTYRITFTAAAVEVRREYLAVLIKREDGTLYFDTVLAL